jgi:hypothetical protein
MKISFNFKSPHSNHSWLPIGNPLGDRIGFWADVTEVDSTQNKVSVISDTGMKIIGIPVVSNEWVCPKTADKKYLSASRNLPPIGSRVFVLMPNKTYTSAFVLCSGYPLGEPKTKTYFADANNKNKLNNERYTKTVSGWEIIENYKSGNIDFISKDEDIKVSLTCEKEGNKNKGINISINGVVLSIEGKNININTDGNLNIDCKELNVNNGAFKVT